jgi:hypothetical protein
MNGVPVANQDEGEQKKGNQEQSGSLRGINRMPMMLVAGVVLALSFHHAHIVRRSENACMA